jgi:Pyruvate/2-oxoacid:ferredoxin oxidoreductase delta subunit
MKIRKYFISNSSTTSFICEICGRSKTYHDSISYRDLGFVRCENNHRFCEEEILAIESQNENEDYIDYDVSEKACPICQFECGSSHDLRKYFLKTTNISEEEVFSEVKKANKRRRKLYDTEYNTYCFLKLGTNENDLLKKLKEEYGDYKSFSKFLYDG